MTSHDDDEIQLILNEVERQVGSLADGQRDQVRHAIRANSAGVLALATRLSTTTTIRSKVAVFVTSIQRGEHLEERTQPTRPSATAARRYPSTSAELTPHQIETNRRTARIMRRTVALNATSAILAATPEFGETSLDTAERILDQLSGEPDPDPAPAMIAKARAQEAP